MPSEAQSAANRANSKKSTGPKTDQGKAASSQNARKHGLSALVMPSIAADRRRFKALAKAVREEFAPETDFDRDLVERLIVARFNISQAERVLQGFWDIAEFPDLPRPTRMTERYRCRLLAQALISDTGGRHVLSLILRYKTAALREGKQINDTFIKNRHPEPEERETKPIFPAPNPLSNPYHRQDLYRQLADFEHDAKRTSEPPDRLSNLDVGQASAEASAHAPLEPGRDPGRVTLI